MSGKVLTSGASAAPSWLSVHVTNPGDRQVVTVLADHLAATAKPPPGVFALGDGFHVGDVLAQPVPTQMVDDQPIGDRAVRVLPGCAVGTGVGVPSDELPVPVGVPSANPGPASSGVNIGDPAPEILSTILQDVMGGLNAEPFIADSRGPFVAPKLSSEPFFDDSPLGVPALEGWLSRSDGASPDNAFVHMRMIPRELFRGWSPSL